MRIATRSDIDAVSDLLRFAHDESPNYSLTSYHEKRAQAALFNFITNPRSVVIVDDEVNQVVIGDIQPDWLGEGFTAQVHLMYAKPGTNGIKSIQSFRKWAKQWPQVNKIQISVSFAGARAETAGLVFERLGYTPVGQQFVEIF